MVLRQGKIDVDDVRPFIMHIGLMRRDAADEEYPKPSDGTVVHTQGDIRLGWVVGSKGCPLSLTMKVRECSRIMASMSTRPSVPLG